MSEQISTRIQKETLEEVKKYAKEKRYNLSQAVRIILEDWALVQSVDKEQGEVAA